MEKSFWWVWKFMLQALGASVFLLPYVTGQVGIIAFSIFLIGEAFVTGNSMIIFHDLAQAQDRTEAQKAEVVSRRSRRHKSGNRTRDRRRQEEDRDDDCHSDEEDIGQYMMRTNYFTIVSDFLDGSDSNFWYWVICFVFLLEVVLFLDAGGLANLTPTERPGYYLLVHLMLALLLIGVEDVTEKLERHRASVTEVTNTATVKHCLVETLRIKLVGQNPLEMDNRKRNMIDMQAVAERLHGYSWKRCCLFFLFLFFVVAMVDLRIAMSDVSSLLAFSNISSTLCTGLLHPTYYTKLDWKFFQNCVMCVSIILLSLMHFAIFLPICLKELRFPGEQYFKSVRRSSAAFITIFLFIAIFGNHILGHSAPVLFPTAFGSSIYGVNIGLIASLFTVVAMLLRVMACCRLVQVLFRSQSDSAFWIIVSLLFVVSYWISRWTSSVLHLGIMLGGGTSNLLLIIFPRMAYLKYLKGKNQPASGSFVYKQTLSCALGHMMLLLWWVINGCYYIWNGRENMIDIRTGENCKYIFDELWKRGGSQQCRME